MSVCGSDQLGQIVFIVCVTAIVIVCVTAIVIAWILRPGRRG